MQVKLQIPFASFTEITESDRVVSTPFGISIGAFAILDIVASLYY